MQGGGAVARFYERQNNRLVWLSAADQTTAVNALLAALHSAPVDGLAAGPQLARQAQQALQLARSGHPAAKLDADRTLSAAWVRYVQALRRPPQGTLYGSEAVVPHSGVDLILSDLARAPSLLQHVRGTSNVNPIYAQLKADAVNQYRQWGVVDPRLQGDLDRSRALPAKGRFVLVNIASARLFMIEDGQIVDSMRVIVGKDDKQTPMLASMIHYATFNPYWNVPDDLVRDRIAPNVLNLGTKYLRERGYEVMLNWSETSPVLSAETIDWRAVAAGRERIRVRQKPGAANSMGNLKFSFPNSEGIYLHDTPNKELFEKDVRALSAGCVRLEDAERLAGWLLRRQPWGPAGVPEAHVPLPEGVPIYLTHLTVRPRGTQSAMIDQILGVQSATGSGVN
jgi:murein L,D-transpeptidase YcbB/YkuD